jgi:rare lipoprotein A
MNLMLFSKTLLAIGLTFAIGSSVQAATFSELQTPKSSFDGVHNKQWDPSSVDRIQPLQASLARSCGVASFYGPGFHGKVMASGKLFDQYSMVAAHPSLPFGTRIRVTNQANGRSVVVTGLDRGPYYGGRILDLSYGAFARIANPSRGLANVCYERIS